jgi:HD-like signal output (HDOD) protein
MPSNPGDEVGNVGGGAAAPHDEGAQKAGATAGGPLGMLLPCDLIIWNEARRLIGDKNVRVEDLATVAAQDPAIVLELLKVANAMYFSGGRPPITTTKQAIQRLGSDVTIDLLEKLKERMILDHEDVAHWYEIHRSRSRRASIVAKVLAEVNNKNISDDCQTVGLMSNVGDLLAVCYFQDRYVSLAEEYSRGSLNFRLAQDLKFDIEKIGLAFLRRNGIPEVLLFALDRDAAPKSPERAIMRPVCAAANEMVDAFDANKWEKLAPGKKLPPMSPIRILGFSEGQYLKVYERVSEYLFSVRMTEEKKRNAALAAAAVTNTTSSAAAAVDAVVVPTSKLEPDFEELIKEESPTPPSSTRGAEVELEDDIQNLINLTRSTERPGSTLQEAPPITTKSVRPSTEMREVTHDIKVPKVDLGQFNLKGGGPTKSIPRVEEVRQVVAPPPMRTSGGNQFINNVCGMLNEAKTSEELLSKLLESLVKPSGPFVRTALIVVSTDRKNALVVAARGPNIGNGQRLTIDDALSPLAACFSKVQSFGTKKSAVSPFGSKAFALAPIDADHESPVALYADCGDEASLTFEARRIFRNVVEVLNQKLPQIPGGILVELAETT